MAATKTVRTLATAVNMAGVSANGVLGAAVTLTAGYGGTLSWKISNGAAGPTTPPVFQVEISHDNSEWFKHGGGIQGSTTNSEVLFNSVDIPIGAQYVRTVQLTQPAGGTGSKPTFDCVMTEVTAI